MAVAGTCTHKVVEEREKVVVETCRHKAVVVMVMEVAETCRHKVVAVKTMVVVETCRHMVVVVVSCKHKVVVVVKSRDKHLLLLNPHCLKSPPVWQLTPMPFEAKADPKRGRRPHSSWVLLQFSYHLWSMWLVSQIFSGKLGNEERKFAEGQRSLELFWFGVMTW